jgi:hypothetical protein
MPGGVHAGVGLLRTRHPETLLAANNEPPLDNSDRLCADMDRHGVRYAMVQARPGPVGSEDVAKLVSPPALRPWSSSGASPSR